MNWTNISVEDAVFPAPTCRMDVPLPQKPGWHGTEYRECGAPADKIVTRTSEVSGYTFTDPMCHRHAKPWIEAAKEAA